MEVVETSNTPSINRLPVELLQNIFAACSIGELKTLLRTCKHWSRIVLSTPGLWTRLDITQYNTQLESYIQACYARSGDMLLDVRIDFSGFLTAATYRSMVLPEWTNNIIRLLVGEDGKNGVRWRSLDVVWPYASFNFEEALKAFEIPMPNLRELGLTIYNLDRKYVPDFGKLPKLERYEFRDTTFGEVLPFHEDALKHVGALRCVTNSWIPQDGETISKFVNITTLELFNHTAEATARGDFPSEITLPHVRTLHLVGNILITNTLALPALQLVILERNELGHDSKFRLVPQLMRWKVKAVELRFAGGNAELDRVFWNWVGDVRTRCWDLKELVMPEWVYDLLEESDKAKAIVEEEEARVVIITDYDRRKRREYKAYAEEWLVSQMMRI